MVGEALLAAPMAVAVAGTALLAWLFGPPERDRCAESARVDRSAGVVECSVCGAWNDLDYRFCRGCVAELPTAPGSVDATVGPARRDLN